MARLPALVDALTAADGRRDRATIDNIARAIREDGLLPETKRGLLATPMSVVNAADLLIAVNMPVPRGEAAAAAEQFRTLRRLPRSDRGNAGVPKALGEAETFGEALELLIAQADALGAEFMQWADKAWSNIPAVERYKLFLPKLLVEFVSTPAARIALAYDRGSGPQAEFTCEYILDINQPPGFYTGAKSDRLITVSVGLPTILRLHDVLFPLEGGA